MITAESWYRVFGELRKGLIPFGFVLVTLSLTPCQKGKTGRAIMHTAARKYRTGYGT
jgi:hypothetical protein